MTGQRQIGGGASGRPNRVMEGRQAKTALSLLLLLFLMVGCARPPVPAERPSPVAFDKDKLRERAVYWRDYQAKFRIKVDSKTSKFSARAFVLNKGLHFSRFETFSPLGQTSALFVSNEAGPSLLIPSERMIFTAQKPETLINYFIGVTLPLDLFRYALAGAVPPDQIEALEMRSDAGTIHAISNTQHRWVDWQFISEGPALSGAFIRSDTFEGRISYDPPVAMENEASPRKIRISSAEWTMDISLEEIKPASNPDQTLFYLPSIPDIRKVDLDTIK